MNVIMENNMYERNCCSARPLINVIVPVYCVEQYLRECIESILKQTYDNFRLILVDDGSTDKSPEICDYYKSVDDRIVVIHRANGGLSAARNMGLDYAEQNSLCVEEEYVAFIDSDDYVAPDYLEFLYQLLIENHADISQCGHFLVFRERKKEKNNNHNTVNMDRLQALESLCYNGLWDVSPWNKLYKLKIFKNLRFTEGLLYEDTAISYLVADRMQNVVINMSPKYYYVQRNTSIANGLQWKEYKIQFIAVGDMFADWIQKNAPELSTAANVKRVFVRLSTLSQMVNCNHYDREQVQKMKKIIFQYRWEVLKNRKVSMRDKLGIIAISFGYVPYWFLWKSYYLITHR